MIFGEGERRYELVEGWGDLPEGWIWGEVSSVAVDSRDRVHVYARTDHPYMIFDRSGKLEWSWGQGIFEDPHGICITPDDDVYIIDRDAEVCFKFTNDGRHLLTVGTRHQPSDTGYFNSDVHTSANYVVTKAGAPFNYPTDIAYAPTGEFYVSDGYRNCRVHKYAADGTHLFSWGEPGDGPGQFNLVHSVWQHHDRVYVADRSNNRIQIFSPAGDFLAEWPDFRLPTKIYVDRNDIVYVAELEARVSVLDLDGNLLCRWGGEASHARGMFVGPHGIWTDSEDSLYVSEVREGKRLQKFVRVS